MGTGTREGLLPGEVKCSSVRVVCGQVGVQGYFSASVSKEPVIPSILYLAFKCLLCLSIPGLLVVNRISCFIRGRVSGNEKHLLSTFVKQTNKTPLTLEPKVTPYTPHSPRLSSQT